MKYCIFAIAAMATIIVYGDKLIYDTGFSRREIMPPLHGYLVMDAFGNFSELPDLQHGEAMILFSDGANLRYSAIPKPTKYNPTIVYDDGTAKELNPTVGTTIFGISDSKVMQNQLKAWGYETQKPTLQERLAQCDATNRNELIRGEQQRVKAEKEKIDAERKKIDSGYYDEQKRKQNEALKAWGY